MWLHFIISFPAAMGEWAFLLFPIAANKWRYSFPNFSYSSRRATAAHCRFNLHFLNDKHHRTPFYLYLFHTYHFCGVFRSFAFSQIILIKLYGLLKIYFERVPLSIMWFINVVFPPLFSPKVFAPFSLCCSFGAPLSDSREHTFTSFPSIFLRIYFFWSCISICGYVHKCVRSSEAEVTSSNLLERATNTLSHRTISPASISRFYTLILDNYHYSIL